MRARVMISSVVNDSIERGDLGVLCDCWSDYGGLARRLGGKRNSDRIAFGTIRKEVKAHLLRKYNFDPYIFEETPGYGRAAEEQTVREVETAHLVLGIFGSSPGWKVPDQDPLTPTLREWRAALQRPLKFKLFWLEGSISPDKLTGELGSVVQAITDYKRGVSYLPFRSAADLLLKIETSIQEHVNVSVMRYSLDAAAREPTAEAEKWSLASYRTRANLMEEALRRTAVTLGIKDGVLKLGNLALPVSMHCVPDSFAVADARKFVAYVFDDEGARRAAGDPGRIQVIACFRGVTDGQIRRFLGNVEATEVYSASWGLYACDPFSGRQAVYLPRCDNSLRMESALSNAISWLESRIDSLRQLSEHRKRILDLSVSGVPARTRSAGSP